jgi:hypothetical protein
LLLLIPLLTVVTCTLIVIVKWALSLKSALTRLIEVLLIHKLFYSGIPWLELCVWQLLRVVVIVVWFSEVRLLRLSEIRHIILLHEEV